MDLSGYEIIAADDATLVAEDETYLLKVLSTNLPALPQSQVLDYQQQDQNTYCFYRAFPCKLHLYCKIIKHVYYFSQLCLHITSHQDLDAEEEHQKTKASSISDCQNSVICLHQIPRTKGKERIYIPVMLPIWTPRCSNEA